jgi:large subunit ribosomal protein L25
VSDAKLAAEKRTQFGKGAARKIRRDHKIPAVMYGHGSDPIHITLPGHDSMMALKQANALLTIVLGDEEHLALAKDVQRDPIKPVIEHIDLVIVKKGEKVVVEIPVHVEGEAAPETVSVEGLLAGTQILAGAVELPKGATLVTDAEALVVNVTAMISEEALEAELAESEAGTEAGESGEAAAEVEAAADEKAADA